MQTASLLVFLTGPGLALLFFVLLFLFGSSKLPGLARGLKNFGANFRLGKKEGIPTEPQKKINKEKS